MLHGFGTWVASMAPVALLGLDGLGWQLLGGLGLFVGYVGVIARIATGE